MAAAVAAATFIYIKHIVLCIVLRNDDDDVLLHGGDARSPSHAPKKFSIYTKRRAAPLLTRAIVHYYFSTSQGTIHFSYCMNGRLPRTRTSECERMFVHVENERECKALCTRCTAAARSNWALDVNCYTFKRKKLDKMMPQPGKFQEPFYPKKTRSQPSSLTLKQETPQIHESQIHLH